MSEFDDFIRGIGSDIKSAAEQVGKKAEETFEISRRRAEKVRIKGNIQKNYQKLGELVYGGIKTNDDIHAEMETIISELDADFERITEIYDEINAIKNGTYVPEDEEDWEEEYAEGYDEEESEVEVAIVVKNDGEITEEPAVIETTAEEVAEELPAEVEAAEEPAEKSQEFDINID